MHVIPIWNNLYFLTKILHYFKPRNFSDAWIKVQRQSKLFKTKIRCYYTNVLCPLRASFRHSDFQGQGAACDGKGGGADRPQKNWALMKWNLRKVFRRKCKKLPDIGLTPPSPAMNYVQPPLVTSLGWVP